MVSIMIRDKPYLFYILKFSYFLGDGPPSSCDAKRHNLKEAHHCLNTM